MDDQDLIDLDKLQDDILIFRPLSSISEEHIGSELSLEESMASMLKLGSESDLEMAFDKQSEVSGLESPKTFSLNSGKSFEFINNTVSDILFASGTMADLDEPAAEPFKFDESFSLKPVEVDGEKTPTNETPSILDKFVQDSPNTSPVKSPITHPSPQIPLVKVEQKELHPSGLALKRSATVQLKRAPTRLKSPSKHLSAFRSKPVIPHSPATLVVPETEATQCSRSTPSSPLKRMHQRSSSVMMESTILTNSTNEMPLQKQSAKKSFIPRLKQSFTRVKASKP